MGGWDALLGGRPKKEERNGLLKYCKFRFCYRKDFKNQTGYNRDNERGTAPGRRRIRPAQIKQSKLHRRNDL